MKKVFLFIFFGFFVKTATAQVPNNATFDYKTPTGDIGSIRLDSIRGNQGGGTVTSVTGSGTGGAVVTVTNGTTTPNVAVALSAIPNASLANSSVTIAGQTVALGGTTTLGFSNLTGSATVAQLPLSIPNANLANSSVTIDGTATALGGTFVLGSTTVTSTGTDALTARHIRCNPSADITRTLPASPPDGFAITYKRINATGNITIVPNSGQTLSEGTQVRLISNLRSITLVYVLSTTQWSVLD